MGAEDVILELRGVTSGYLPEVDVLRQLSMSVTRGEITSIIGANGAGKSTVLRTVFGFLTVRSGSIVFLGRDVAGWRPLDAVKGGIAYVAQGRCNFPEMTVLENIETACYSRHDREIASDVNELLLRFPVLREKRREAAGNLSGGQQQLLEMAMGLATGPKLLLIDEPTLGLSPKMCGEVFEYIKQIRRDGITVLMVEQNAARALDISDHAYVLRLGQNWMEGTGQEILHDPDVREQYLGYSSKPNHKVEGPVAERGDHAG